jgi:hypothetical protein
MYNQFNNSSAIEGKEKKKVGWTAEHVQLANSGPGRQKEKKSPKCHEVKCCSPWTLADR